MFLKKNNENIVFFLSYVAIAFSYLYLRNSLFSHWSDILDQDVTIIYNALLLGSNIQQEYLDHPAYTTIFFLNIFFKLGYFFQLIEVKNINTLLLSENKDLALQHIHNFSQTIHILYSIILVLILRNLLERILNDKISSFILSIIFMLSPSFIFLLEIIRSEILSLIFIFLFYICLDNYINKSIIYVFYSGIFFTLALLSKVQVIICFIPLLIIVFLLNYKKLLIREKINISNVANIILTFFLLIFTIYIVDNFFYKRIDKIVFIIIFFILLFFLSYFDKKKFNQNNINLSLFLFFIGCSSIIVLLKFLSFLGLKGS